jgi:hypothetical protein
MPFHQCASLLLGGQDFSDKNDEHIKKLRDYIKDPKKILYLVPSYDDKDERTTKQKRHIVYKKIYEVLTHKMYNDTKIREIIWYYYHDKISVKRLVKSHNFLRKKKNAGNFIECMESIDCCISIIDLLGRTYLCSDVCLIIKSFFVNC